MSWPFQPMLTLDELKVRLAAAPYNARWVDQPDPTGQFESGYFERNVKGRAIGAPVSIKRGAPLNPRMVYQIYRRLDIDDEPFPLN
jgi:hypothetical protein